MDIVLYLFTTHIILYWITSFFYIYKYNQRLQGNWHAVNNVLVNQLVVTPLYWVAFNYYPDPLSVYHVVWQLPLIVVLTDLIFYVLHRLFHWNKTIYNNVHKIHHDYDPPIACAGLYCHPIEHLCVNLASTVFPMFAVHASLTVALLWTTIASINVVISHSNIHGGAHTTHHKYLNCNYGVGGLFMDRMFNTLR